MSGRRGFDLPAAGKTGTSRDGWFAGYTKDYIVIAWVGFDDNSDLNMEGAKSALPIWTEFMMKAQALYPPRDIDAMYFEAPEGIVQVNVEHDDEMNCRSRAALRTTRRPISPERSSPPVHCGGPRRDAGLRFRSTRSEGFFGRLFGEGSRTRIRLLNRQIIAQNLPLLLTDSRNRQKFLDALDSRLSFPEIRRFSSQEQDRCRAGLPTAAASQYSD